MRSLCLLAVVLLLAWHGHADPSIGGTQDQNNQAGVGVPPPAQNQNAQPQAQQQQPDRPGTPPPLNDNSARLAQRAECRGDVENFCKKTIDQLPAGEILNDMAALDCLQEAGYSEAEKLTPACSQAVWEYKIQITQDVRFIGAIKQFCSAEIEKTPKIKECTLDERPGYALSCMMDHAHDIDQASQCFQFLLRTERVAFSDFRLIAPFVDHCANLILDLGCGTLTKPSKHQGVRVPHSQGSTLECLIEKLVNPPRDPVKQKLVQGISKECRHEVMRIAELQSDDFHLDRPLYFACRKDRELFCHDLAAGEGKVFQCLMSHKDDKEMEPECSKILSERAGLMGQDYRLAHPLTKACGNEMTAYKCIPQAGFEKSLQFHLSWVLLCLENGLHGFKQQAYDKTQAEKEGKKPKEMPNLLPFTDECQHEMMGHREMMVQEFRMSPELVMSCAQEIDKFCSPKGDIETEGKTVHCLMQHAQARDEKKVIGTNCMNTLQTLMKVADIGSNYKVDKVLYASCRPLIEGKCKMDAVSEAATLTCLMKNIDGPDMTDDCEQRLVEVQYFMARDWSLDPQLYEACHKEAVDRCSAVDNWNVDAKQSGDYKVDPGPQVLACLYRAGYDEEKPLTPACADNVRRVLRSRAVRVNLLPGVEENCREALSEYCSTNVKPTEEMNCLQEQFERKHFKDRYPKCHEEVTKFTQMESKDTRLNRLLTRACRPVIDTYCNQFINEEIDHGDVMECLASHKDTQEMSPKCRSYVNHFELISLRDYHFSFRFTQACQQDIQDYCAAFGQDKGGIIRCLSNIMFEHRVLGESKDLHKDCKKQLRVAYLQQEQAGQFDDQSHMKDADPEMITKCDKDLKRLDCLKKKSFEDVVECLRVDFDNLDPDCKAMVFSREKIEAMDNTFDDGLQKACKYDIGKFCSAQEGEKVLDCLSNTKVVRLLQKGCQAVVSERLLERVKDDRLNPTLLDACKQETQQYCPEDFKKINDPRYAKQQLGGIVASCLRSKYSQFGTSVHLSFSCKDEVSKLILESEFDIQLDPVLYKSCKAIINKHCANAILSKGGNFDTVLECLKADFYTSQISDPDCARQLARRTQESLVDIHLDPGLHEACSMDIQRVCKDVLPGQSRIIMCLMDALGVPQIQISPACRNKLTERQKLWNMAHDEYKMVLPESWSEVYHMVATHPHRTSILTWMGGCLLVLLLLGCCCGRWTKRLHTELKNR